MKLICPHCPSVCTCACVHVRLQRSKKGALAQVLKSFHSTVFPRIVLNSKVCVVCSGSKLVDCKIKTWLVKGWRGFWLVGLSLLGAGPDSLLTHKIHSSAAQCPPPRVLLTSLPICAPQVRRVVFAIGDPLPAGDRDLLKMRLTGGLIVCLGEPCVASWNEVSGISRDRSGRHPARGGSCDAGSPLRASPSRAASSGTPSGVAVPSSRLPSNFNQLWK